MLTQLKVPDLYAAQTIVNRELQAVCRRYIEYTVLVYRTYYCILEFNLFQVFSGNTSLVVSNSTGLISLPNRHTVSLFLRDCIYTTDYYVSW